MGKHIVKNPQVQADPEGIRKKISSGKEVSLHIGHKKEDKEFNDRLSMLVELCDSQLM